MIIGVFLAVLILISNVLKIPQAQLWNDIMIRFGMNAILVLAMVPSIQAGIGINFNLALGVVLGGLIGGALVSMEFNFTGWVAFGVALLIAIPPLAIIFGYLYGLMLNKVKGARDDSRELCRIFSSILYVHILVTSSL